MGRTPWPTTRPSRDGASPPREQLDLARRDFDEAPIGPGGGLDLDPLAEREATGPRTDEPVVAGDDPVGVDTCGRGVDAQSRVRGA
jgi:hypothetical protein